MLPLSVKAQVATANAGQVQLSADDVQRHPEVVYHGLLQSLIRQDLQGIALFLPIYQRQPGADKGFVQWAQAVRAWHHDENYHAAVRLYRGLLARYPDNEVIRLQLAMVLFENQDNEAAEQQFRKLRSGKLTPMLERVIDSYLAAIRARDFWSFSTSLSYVNESNINNAPPPGTQLKGWTPAPAEAARGFSYGLQMSKSWSHTRGLFSEFRFDGDGKRFWNNPKYDELTLRNSIGMGYRDNDLRVQVLPFFEQRWYAGGGAAGNAGQSGLRRYASQHGVTLESRRQLSAHWLAYAQGEYGVNRYKTRHYLNGDEYQLAATMVYFPSPEQYWFAGLNYQQQNTRDKDDSYYRYGARAGWSYEWRYGISSRVQVSYARKQYRGKDFFGILQQNNEYSAMITLWHRGFYFWGVTPKISWAYQKNASNHPFYRFDKSRLFLNLSKEF